MIREPYRYSLDRVLGIRLPAWVGPLGLVGLILTLIYAELEADEPTAEQEEAPPQEEKEEEEGAQDEAREDLAGP
jgi:hypothetical protein